LVCAVMPLRLQDLSETDQAVYHTLIEVYPNGQLEARGDAAFFVWESATERVEFEFRTQTSRVILKMNRP
jgi:hypothetical protein